MVRAAFLLTAIVLVALLAYSTWTMVDRCDAKARAILAEADPLDRSPPPLVVSTIEKLISTYQLPGLLATILLDRYECRGSGTSWLVDHPALAWWLRKSYRRSTLVGLYASTADFGNDRTGLNSGARRIYRHDITELDGHAVGCLVRKVQGWSPVQPDLWGNLPMRGCPSEPGIPPIP